MKLHALLTTLCVVCCASSACTKAAFISRDDREKVKSLISLYASGNWEVRRKAVQRLSEYPSTKAEKAVIAACDDPHSLVRIDAVKGLARYSSYEAKNKIRTIADNDADNNVRWSALTVLASYRDPSAAPVFVKGLSSGDWLIREESIRGLLMIDDFAVRYFSIPYVIQAFNDSSINVRMAAIKNIKIRDHRIYMELVRMLDDSMLRKNTLLKVVLGALDGYTLDVSTRKKIITLLTHSNVEVRLLALRVLKKDDKLKKERR